MSAGLQATIERLVGAAPAAERFGPEYFEAFEELRAALNEGAVRAAEPREPSAGGPARRWHVNVWVKEGILLGFRIGRVIDRSMDYLHFFDKDTLPMRAVAATEGVRIVPGGSSVRDGCYIGRQVICMPPCFINIGAYVDEGTLIDSHALVGSCAQVGKRVHVSAGAQIGGVLEPVGALPVIVEDEVLIGGNCGVYEGAVVRERAVLAAGTILTGSTPVYDLVNDRVIERTETAPLEIPPGAVVVPGARAVTRGRGGELGVSLYTPVIVKYRDAHTDRSVRLEEYLR